MDMPGVREALESGRVSFANAARLAQAAEGVEASAVEADASLLAKAESMTDDQFAREARRWTASQQADRGEADYQRRRARRWLRLWDGDGGMTQRPCSGPNSTIHTITPPTRRCLTPVRCPPRSALRRSYYCNASANTESRTDEA